MLRVSADETKTDINLQMINGDLEASAGDIAHAVPLMKFAEALASRDELILSDARQQLLEAAGSAVLVDAAAVAGNFQRMVRIADATGIPVDDMREVASGSASEELDLQRFASAQNSLSGQ
jgi:hypothetical protein